MSVLACCDVLDAFAGWIRQKVRKRNGLSTRHRGATLLHDTLHPTPSGISTPLGSDILQLQKLIK